MAHKLGIPGRYIYTYAVCILILKRFRDGARLFSWSSKTIDCLGHNMPVSSTPAQLRVLNIASQG